MRLELGIKAMRIHEAAKTAAGDERILLYITRRTRHNRAPNTKRPPTGVV
jgi:hypothetical protein